MTEILKNVLQANKCASHVHLFMPDHCHFLLQGEDESSNSREALIRFKQKTGYWFSKNFPIFEWQKDFYDHILRTDEALNKQITYILHNPVRKGIVSDWKSYPHKGSTKYDLETWDGYY